MCARRNDDTRKNLKEKEGRGERSRGMFGCVGVEVERDDEVSV